MKMSQGNSQCNYLKQAKFFFFYKIREQGGRTGLAWGVGSGRWVDMNKGYTRENIVKILCI
jgi:hypothetical protein